MNYIPSLILFVGLLALTTCILANHIRQNPKWLQCRRCLGYRNELGEHQVAPPPDVHYLDIENEDTCDLCAERLKAKARQHHNCCHQ